MSPNISMRPQHQPLSAKQTRKHYSSLPGLLQIVRRQAWNLLNHLTNQHDLRILNIKHQLTTTMTVIAIEVLRMSGWSIEKRHCLHILATHYPTSTWAERTAIFNDVCNDNRTANQVRDEYGGHLAGQRVRPNGLKPTRSVQWNDHVCRDEFVTGPFTQQQQIDRGTIFDRIQTSISTAKAT